MQNRLMAAVAVAALMSSYAYASTTLDAPVDGVVANPHVLSSEDARLYRAIFADERAGKFAAAKSLAAELSDQSLIGYAEAERYLSPKAKRVPAKQLNIWLEAHDDLPIAAKVRELAEKRNHRRHRIEIAALAPVHLRGGGYEDPSLPEPPMASDVGRAAQIQIANYIHASQPDQANATLQVLIGGNSAPSTDIARLSQRVAASYLAEGQDDAVVRVGSAVVGMDRAVAPLLDWYEGIANYRLGKFDLAAQHFEALAQVGSIPSYTRSAAAFWAARAHLQAGDPLRVVTLLTAATREQPTFYGLLAERLLGQQSAASFADPVLDTASFASLMQIPAAHRAVALWQIGETDTLAGEMDRALSAINLRQGEAYAALARKLDLPNQELRACETAASRGVMLTGLFPVPHYAPASGYHLDPSLVLAFTRAESRFKPDAVSGTGARGLMQIMPATAVHMDGSLASDKRLENPSYNLDLGQRYLTQLLGQVNGNLVELAAAYNAGPGALTRWMGVRGTMMDDPLLFIESIPAGQTRDYVKKVMTYYWMYARRNGTDAPTLDQTASGKWPTYQQNGQQPLPASNVVVSDASAPH